MFLSRVPGQVSGVPVVLQGTFTSHPQAGPVINYQEGQSFAEGKDSNHWVENLGTKPLIVIAVDILKQP